MVKDQRANTGRASAIAHDQAIEPGARWRGDAAPVNTGAVGEGVTVCDGVFMARVVVVQGLARVVELAPEPEPEVGAAVGWGTSSIVDVCTGLTPDPAVSVTVAVENPTCGTVTVYVEYVIVVHGGAVGTGDCDSEPVCSGLTSVGVATGGGVSVIVVGTLVMIPGFSGT